MGHCLIGAGMGAAAFVLVLAQGGGIALAIAAYAGIGAVCALALAILPEAIATLAGRLMALEDSPAPDWIPARVLTRR